MERQKPNFIDEGILKIKRTIDDVYDFFSKVKNFHTEKEIDEIVAYYSDAIDKRILESEEKNGWTYAGGQFRILYKDEQSYELKVDFYYQDDNEEWVKETSSFEKPMVSLKPKSTAELREKKEIIFEIDEPKRETSPEKTAEANNVDSEADNRESEKSPEANTETSED